MSDKFSTWEILSGLSITGVVIGIGQLLASTEPLTPRLIFGRAFVSLGVSLPAGLMLLQFPDAHPIVLIAAGATLASLGTSFLEQALKSKFGVSS